MSYCIIFDDPDYGEPRWYAGGNRRWTREVEAARWFDGPHARERAMSVLALCHVGDPNHAHRMHILSDRAVPEIVGAAPGATVGDWSEEDRK